jgi:hypothetical protein
MTSFVKSFSASIGVTLVTLAMMTMSNVAVGDDPGGTIVCYNYPLCTTRSNLDTQLPAACVSSPEVCSPEADCKCRRVVFDYNCECKPQP